MCVCVCVYTGKVQTLGTWVSSALPSQPQGENTFYRENTFYSSALPSQPQGASDNEFFEKSYIIPLSYRVVTNSMRSPPTSDLMHIGH